MKIFGIIILMLLQLSNCNHHKDTYDFIEFKHVGVEEKIIRPLFISFKEVNISLNLDTVNINGVKMNLSTRDKALITSSYYSVLIVDKTTLSYISFFIRNYKNFKNIDKIDKQINFSIILNNNVFFLTYLQTNPFYRALINYLKSKRCKTTDIDALTVFFQNNNYYTFLN